MRRENAILPETRWAARFLLPFLALAFAILYFFPGRTAEFFAWPVAPPMTALFFGSAYLAGAYFFFRVAAGGGWTAVRAGFLPVAAFAALEALSTLLHWPKFSHTHPAFFAWAGLYFVTPWLVLLLWLRSRRAAPAQPAAGDPRVPPGLRLALGVFGLLLTGAVAYLYLYPALMSALWPWSLTPLTARATLGFLLLTALAELSLALEPAWRGWRVLVQAQMLVIALVLLAVPRAWGDFNPARPATWIFIALLALFLLFDGLIYLRLDAAQAASRSAAPKDPESSPL